MKIKENSLIYFKIEDRRLVRVLFIAVFYRSLLAKVKKLIVTKQLVSIFAFDE